MMNRAGRRRRAVLPLLPLVAALGAAGLGFAPELRCPKVNGQLSSRWCGRPAKPQPPPVARQISKLDSLGFKRQQLHDAARNVAFIAAIAATIAGSWIFTGKWWKVPLGLALPSMIYRLWTTRGSTEKLAQVSASVDSKYIASTEEETGRTHSTLLQKLEFPKSTRFFQSFGSGGSGAMGAVCCRESETKQSPVEVVQAVDHCFEVSTEAQPKTDVPPTPPAFNHEAERRDLQLQAMQRLELDEELLRGISLRKSLKGGGGLWLKSPLDLSEEQRSQLWGRSKQVSGIDIFLSHTWRTDGRWKVLSLTLQSGWSFALVCWAAAVGVVFILCELKALPATSTIHVQVADFEGTCPLSPWILIASMTAFFLGLFLSPYVPNLFGEEICFLDVVSINQSDHQLMERGIYGLGGFLSVSKQLRVLWSPQYLDRLWCVFELAAYRKANPKGKIVLAPLYIEAIVSSTMLGSYAVLFMFWLTQAMNVSIPLTYAGYILSLIPAYVAFHFFRLGTRQKKQLVAELQNFDVQQADCRSDYDREFVFQGITTWYGSTMAFNEYVRGPLFQELVQPLSRNQVPAVYWSLLVTPTISSGLEFFMAIWKGGGTRDALLSHFIGVVIGAQLCWFLVSCKLGFALCYRFAGKSRLDLLKTLLIFLVFVFCVVFGTGLATLAYTSSVDGAIAFACGASLIAIISFQWRRIWRLTEKS